MNENMKMWVNALRTTSTPQAKERLASYDEEGQVGYCCLGFGCKIAGIERRDLDFLPDWVAESREPVAALFGAGEAETLAPVEFMKWLGLVGDDVRESEWDLRVLWPESGWPTTRLGRTFVDGGSGIGTLAALNDSGFTFAQIADIIDYFGVTPA